MLSALLIFPSIEIQNSILGHLHCFSGYVAPHLNVSSISLLWKGRSRSYLERARLPVLTINPGMCNAWRRGKVTLSSPDLLSLPFWIPIYLAQCSPGMFSVLSVRALSFEVKSSLFIYFYSTCWFVPRVTGIFDTDLHICSF